MICSREVSKTLIAGEKNIYKSELGCYPETPKAFDYLLIIYLDVLISITSKLVIRNTVKSMIYCGSEFLMLIVLNTFILPALNKLIIINKCMLSNKIISAI